MTDFYAQLEQQLADAGRQRAVQGGRRRAAGRARVVAMACGVVLARAAGGALVPGLFSGTPPATTGPTAPQPASPSGVKPAPIRPQPLRGIGVAVLNATTTGGVARSVADLLERRGATIGAISAAADQTAPDTSVSYTDGMEAQAREVAAVLGVEQVVPFRGTPSSVDAGRPAVIVIVGRDRVAP